MFRGDGLRGWARFMCEDPQTPVSAGPADFSTVDVDPVCQVPVSKGWNV